MHVLRTALAALLLVPMLAACDSNDPDLDIVDTVVADAQLTVLEQAVIEANLTGALSADGPLTVFAPTDAAFTAALEALDLTAAELLASPDLAAILQVHVVSGEFEADDLDIGDTLTSLNGEVLTVVADGSGLGLDTEDEGTASNATIVTTLIIANQYSVSPKKRTAPALTASITTENPTTGIHSGRSGYQNVR